MTLIQGLHGLAPKKRVSRLSWVIMAGFASVVIALGCDASVRESTRAWLMNESLAIAAAPTKPFTQPPAASPALTPSAPPALSPAPAPAAATTATTTTTTTTTGTTLAQAKPATKHAAAAAKSRRSSKHR